MFDLKKLIGKRDAATGSISGSIQQIDDLSELYELALGCLSDAIHGIGEHAPDTPRALRDEHRKKLKQIRGLLATPGKSSLETARKHLDAELHVYGRNLEKHLHQHGRDVKEILAMMAAIVDSMASREKQYNTRFRGIAKQLRQVATSRDLAELRGKLAVEVEQFEKCIEDLSHDTQVALDRVRGDLHARAQHSSGGDSTAGDSAANGLLRRPVFSMTWIDNMVDPVTQLAGRPEGLDVISRYKANDVRFCLARFAVYPFEPFLTKYGRGVMDAILKEVAFRIRESFVNAASVVRWNDADFLVVSELPLPELALQVNEAERKLALTFSIPGRGDRLVISCRTAVVQTIRSETAPEMIARVLSSHELVSR